MSEEVDPNMTPTQTPLPGEDEGFPQDKWWRAQADEIRELCSQIQKKIKILIDKFER